MDTVANTLNTLVNAQRVGKKRVAVPYSNFSKALLDFLVQKERVAHVRVQKSPRSKLVVTLAYDGNVPRIQGVRRISRPGRRDYTKGRSISYKYAGTGFMVISTPAGLMDDRQARTKGVGGEVICAIW